MSTTQPRIGLVYQRPRPVAFVRARGPYAEASEKAWSMLSEWVAARRIRLPSPYGYGLAYDNPRTTLPEECRYEACVMMPDDFVELPSDGVSFQVLPGGAFARVRHVGPYSGLAACVAKVRDDWIAAQQHLMLDRRRPFMFTYLNPRGSASEDAYKTDICLPVRTPSDDVFPRLKLTSTVN